MCVCVCVCVCVVWRTRYTDGTQRSLSRRERPHLVFDAQGVPVALTNGATDGWPCTYRVCPKDYCHTALQRLNQKPMLR